MNREIICRVKKTPAGELILGSIEDQLCLCDWKYRRMRPELDRKIQESLNARYKVGSCPVIEEASAQLDLYFKGELKAFRIPLMSIGTEFQKKVWDALLSIPYGETTTYGELSRMIGNTRAVRAVAAANGANVLAVIIPCHRVIGAGGELVGYAGGLDAKRKLLRLESSTLLQPELFD